MPSFGVAPRDDLRTDVAGAFLAATGAITFQNRLSDDTGGINGLGGAAAVVVAPNGGGVFVAGEADSALAAFRRDPATGVLSFRAATLDGSGVDGLASTDGLAISPDGAHVYVAGFGDNAVAIFAPAL